VAAFHDPQPGRGRQDGPHPPSDAGVFGEAGVQVKLPHGRGGPADASGGSREIREERGVEARLDRRNRVFRPENLFLQLFERRGHVALGVGQRLPPDPVRGDFLPVRVADLERVAEDPVEAHLERGNSGAALFLGFDREQRSLRIAAQRAKLVELRVGSVADDSAGRCQNRGVRRER
jgi:hypothetical protein